MAEKPGKKEKTAKDKDSAGVPDRIRQTEDLHSDGRNEQKARISERNEARVSNGNEARKNSCKKRRVRKIIQLRNRDSTGQCDSFSYEPSAENYTDADGGFPVLGRAEASECGAGTKDTGNGSE